MRMQRRAWCVGGLTALLLVGLVWLNAQDNSGAVEIALLTPSNWERFAPKGKEVDAIEGDIVLRNQYLTAVIAQPRESRHANMTVRQVGGALIDLTTRNHPSDQLGTLYPNQKAYPYREWKVLDEDGIALDLKSLGDTEVRRGTIIISAAAADKWPAVTVTYHLEPDEPCLSIITAFSNPGTETLEIPLADDIRIDGGAEWMSKAPNGTGTNFWAHDRYWDQAYAVSVAGGVKLESTTTGNTTTIKYNMAQGESTLKLPPGERFEFSRLVYVGRNLIDVRGEILSLDGGTLLPAQFFVRSASGPIPRAEVTIHRAGVLWGSGRTDEVGQLQTQLPAGQYHLTVHALGIKLAENLRYLHGDPTQPRSHEIQLTNYSPGQLLIDVRENHGDPLPVKVAFHALPGTSQPDFGPVTGDFGVRNLRYAPLGKLEQTLPPGEYKIVISRGPEYDAHIGRLKITPGELSTLNVKLNRAVDTTGWISGDYHSHSSPSGDNTASQRGRVLNHVCEHLEFVPCTEHNRIDSYEPLIQELGVTRYVSTVTGMELTGGPLPLNHQNAFPLQQKPYQQDGGGPVTDADPAVQIERLATWDERSEKVVQVNHPDLGWMFYDQNGDGQPDQGYERMRPHINVLEIHPVDAILERKPLLQRSGYEFPNNCFGWLQLLNQGFRYPGVVNTDAHDNFHGTGWLRNWVVSSSDDPVLVNPQELVRNINQGRMILSNGPFLEVSAKAGSTPSEIAGPGQDLAATGGQVELKVRVQTPNWFDIDRVFVLVNGVLQPEFDFTREKQPDKFRTEGAIRFEQSLSLKLASDAHVIVVTAGEKQKLNEVFGDRWGNVPPVAFNNPIFIDVNGGGFKANGDTLGHPLPVKTPSRKL